MPHQFFHLDQKIIKSFGDEEFRIGARGEPSVVLGFFHVIRRFRSGPLFTCQRIVVT
jgi:hypothetical protein